jgi:hypothetical protein
LRDKAPITADADAVTSYAFKASLVGAAHRFELTDQGLGWYIGSKSGLWPYDSIVGIRLSYRPVSMQSRRFRADIEGGDRGRIVLMSTSWQTSVLMAPQDHDYRIFMVELHRRMAAAGSPAALIGGLTRRVYLAALVMLALVALAMAGLLIRAVAIGEWSGILFLLSFAALFAWQVGGFVRRNRPRAYRFDHLPGALLP